VGCCSTVGMRSVNHSFLAKKALSSESDIWTKRREEVGGRSAAQRAGICRTNQLVRSSGESESVVKPSNLRQGHSKYLQFPRRTSCWFPLFIFLAPPPRSLLESFLPLYPAMRFISIVSVASALVWEACAAPLPEVHVLFYNIYCFASKSRS
jgi:hypothetical protein